jgi:hypothetical protein
VCMVNGSSAPLAHENATNITASAIPRPSNRRDVSRRHSRRERQPKMYDMAILDGAEAVDAAHARNRTILVLVMITARDMRASAFSRNHADSA